MKSWLEALKAGRSFVTNGPMPALDVNGRGLGETVELKAAGKVCVTARVESHVPFNKIEVIVNGKVIEHDEIVPSDASGLWAGQLDVELPIERSRWIAVRVRGSDHPSVFDGPVWAHTSPVYVNVAGQRIASRQDAEYFVEWIEQMLKAVTARNRYASVDDRRQAEALFRRAQNEFGQMIKTIEKRPFARPKE